MGGPSSTGWRESTCARVAPAGLTRLVPNALMDLIHSRAIGSFVVQLAVPAAQLDRSGPSTRVAQRPTRVSRSAPGGRVTGDYVTADCEGDDVVTVTGFGMSGATHVRRAWVESLNEVTGREVTGREVTRGEASRPGARREVVACHADSGALVGVEDPVATRRGRATVSHAYRPPPALVELVKARDGRCRFPGCTVSSLFCDLDHVRPWPSGPTEASNLMCLCRRHHRIKQTVRWRVRIDPDAIVTWTDPTGRTRTTHPIDFLQLDDAFGTTRTLRASDEIRTAAEIIDAPALPSSTARSDASAERVGLLWSALEEELTHKLTRHERGHARGPTGPRQRGDRQDGQWLTKRNRDTHRPVGTLRWHGALPPARAKRARPGVDAGPPPF